MSRFTVLTAAVIGLGVLAAGCGTTHAPVADGPTNVRWEKFQGVPLPVADQGPRQVAGEVVAGFDQSPTGAALAAIHASIRISVADDRQWPLVGQRLLAPGVGRDAWATARAQVSIAAPVASGAAPRVVGFTVGRYAPPTAEVAIYVRQVDQSLSRHITTMEWRGDTWLLRLPERATVPSVSAVSGTPADLVVLR